MTPQPFIDVVLLKDVAGVGRQHQVVTVLEWYALTYLLPLRLALVSTPAVRKKYGERIRKAQEERLSPSAHAHPHRY